MPSRLGVRGLPVLLLAAALACLLLAPSAAAIKFALPALRYPSSKCIWNAAHPGALVIITANVGPGDGQRIDIEVIDSSEHKNVYLSKKNIGGEKRFAITAHAEEDIGVCFKNTLDAGINDGKPHSRVIDLDIDIGADAVDYNAIANQESLSGLETEMRKLEGIVKEITDEMEYLKTREERFQTTNVSTNSRVQNFAWFMFASLFGLGVWQIMHLRSFFKKKYLID
ncbi:emp24/gp25L/p24 family/GOLD-domain-containing protein [Epithele typhae]|uniref:emp24/gp25L/p24 family/GOLD-domain-containing protein n=1 Tax=Epithele typhae TaxID=378194 RepID=UPI002007BC59|nr:emp24/gp25L/p24 family/GOLD-domain-containing protein [Epithele typhae]KAH9941886.1 emp24/gp25L/p24 family/GOLD-domain-containing protein [Epithele typhae]